MKVGDLVCYNTAGQRKKTVGMVLEFRDMEPADMWEKRMYGDRFQIVRILWVLAPSMPPNPYSEGSYWMKLAQRHTTPTWYPNLGWFELVKPS